ncbi:hypothetical protein FRC17_006508 [Serendipita sp. 399]|nr:hypothetical protein FRC17_006508 [Serendipita sp. 399]
MSVTTSPQSPPSGKIADENKILGSIHDEGVIQLSDGTLRCKHGLEVCANCSADYRFMREILDDGEEQWMEDDDIDYDDEEYYDDMGRDAEMREWRAQCETCGEPAQVACDACKQLLYCSAEHRETNKQKHASECPEKPKPTISSGLLLLSDSTDIPDSDSTVLTTNPILSSVNHTLDLSKSSDIQTALESLKGPTPPNAILLMTLLRPSSHSELLTSLSSYVKERGGSLILAFGFGNQTRSFSTAELDEMLTALGLSWRAGTMESSTFNINETIARGIGSTTNTNAGRDNERPLAEVLRRSTLFLPRSYTTEALQLKGIQRNEAVYLNDQHAKPGNEQIQSPTVFSRVGNGWFGYVGQTKIEGMSQYIVKAMINAPPLAV